MTISDPLDTPVDYKAYGYASDKPATKTLTVLTVLAIGGILATAAILSYLAYHTYNPYLITADPTLPFNVAAIGDQVRERNLALILTALTTFCLSMITTWILVTVSERARPSENFGRLFGWCATATGFLLLIAGVTFFSASVEHAATTRYNAEIDSMQAWATDRYGISLQDRQAHGLTTLNPGDGAPTTTSTDQPVQNKETPTGLILINADTGLELPTHY